MSIKVLNIANHGDFFKVFSKKNLRAKQLLLMTLKNCQSDNIMAIDLFSWCLIGQFKTYCLKMPLLNCIMGKNESISLITLLLRENYSFPAPFCGLRDLFNFDKEKRQYYTTICLKNHHSRLCNLLLRYLLKVNVQIFWSDCNLFLLQ